MRVIGMKHEWKIGDIIESGPNTYQLVHIYLDKRTWNGYSVMVGLYSKEHNEVIAAMPGNDVTKYLNNLLIDWKKVQRKDEKFTGESENDKTIFDERNEQYFIDVGDRFESIKS